jgi:hypothetical protein
MPEPTPPTPTDYPAPYFLIKQWLPSWDPTNYTFSVVTDVETRLLLYFSSEPPLKAARKTYRRGAPYWRDNKITYTPNGLFTDVWTSGDVEHFFEMPLFYFSGRYYLQFQSALREDWLDPVNLEGCSGINLAWKATQTGWQVYSKLRFPSLPRRLVLSECTDSRLHKSISPIFHYDFPIVPYILMKLEQWEQWA